MVNKITPIIWFKFDKDSQKNITEEANSHTYDATLYNNAQVKDTDSPIGKKALSLYNRPVNSSANTGQYMSIPPFELGGKLTVTFWFKKNTKDEESARVFDFYNQQTGTTDKQFTAFFDKNGYLKIYKKDKNGSDTMKANNENLCNGKWHYIAIVHDGGYVTVHINNKSSKKQLFSEIETLTRSHNDLGRGSDQKIHYSTINIDDFRVYNTNLDAKDVTEIYNYKKENVDDHNNEKDTDIKKDKDKKNDNKRKDPANTSSTNKSFNDTFMMYYHKNKIATIAVVSIIGIIVLLLVVLFIVKVIVPFVNRLRGSKNSSTD